MVVSTNRPLGRQPTFGLVGLLVVILFLIVKYWTLSSERAHFKHDLKKLSDKSSDIVTIKDDLEVVIDHLRIELSISKKEAVDLEGRISAVEQALDSAKIEYTTNLEKKQKDIERLTGEKEVLEKEKKMFSKQYEECKANDCDKAVKDVLSLVASKVKPGVFQNAIDQTGLGKPKEYNNAQGQDKASKQG